VSENWHEERETTPENVEALKARLAKLNGRLGQG
jgi:hypothetical protein